MLEQAKKLATLRRPRLLIRAARHGVHEYNRERTLDRLIDPKESDTNESVLNALLIAEADIEANRRQGSATYSIAEHIEVLVALMGEARLLTRALRSP